MTHSLLQDVMESPDSDDLRLVYADYLMEQGDPRGNFIAAQVKLQTRINPATRLEAKERSEALMSKHREAFVAPLAPLLQGRNRRKIHIVFRRGFIDQIQMPAASFLQHSDDLFGAEVVTRLTLLEANKATVKALVERGILGRLRVLKIAGSLNASALAILAESEQLGSLDRINLGNCGLKDDAIATLLTSPSFSCKSLTLNSNKLSDVTLRSLADSPQVRSCRQLFLSCNQFTDNGLQHLIGSEHLAGLEQISLKGNRGITKAGGRALQSATSTLLSLRHCEL